VQTSFCTPRTWADFANLLVIVGISKNYEKLWEGRYMCAVDGKF